MMSYEEYEADIERQAKHKIHCEKCGEPIWADEYFATEENDCVCDACFDEWLEEYEEKMRKEYRRNV